MQRDRDLAALTFAIAAVLAACGGGSERGAAAAADAAAGRQDAPPGSDVPLALDAAADAGTDALADAGPTFVPGPAALLSAGNPAGQDEDPSILRARDGSLYAVWYSNRGGLQPDGNEDREIFLARSADGRAWSTPIPITRHAAWAFFPSLAQDTRGVFHLAWWRMTLLPPGCKAGVDCTGTDNKIVYKSSPDGVTWDLDAETIVAAGPGDWLPSIVHDAARDRLLIYFAGVARAANGQLDLGQRTNRLQVAIKDGATWAPPVRLSGVNPDASHNTYPHVLVGGDGVFRMAWTRYDAASPADVLQVIAEPTTETMFATSSDGTVWATPAAMSGGTGIDVFPSLYADHGGSWFVVWLTTALGGAAAVTVELRAGGDYATDLTRRPEIAGYTARVLATPTSGVFWAAWVAGAAPTQKIEHRFFTK